MKKIFILLAMTPGITLAQQTAEFHSKTFVEWKGGHYVDTEGNILNILIHTPTPGTTVKYTGTLGTPGAPGTQAITLNEPIVTDVLTSTPAPQYAGFGKLYGNIRQSHDTLYFYPWPFNIQPLPSSMLSALQTTKSAANTVFTTSEFFIRIPSRRITSLKYNAWQFGALTLPVKVYVSSKIQLNDNTAFDVNIAGMIGKRWGKNNYYNLPSEEKGGSFVKAYSANLLVGITKVEVNSKNTLDTISGTHTLAAITTGFAFGYHYNKVGVFLATGFDIPFGNNSQQWVFNGNPWVGIGLGLKLD